MENVKFFGQKRVQKELDSYFSAIARKNHMNILLSAPSGYGKTTMATYYLKKNGVNFDYFFGEVLTGRENVTVIDEAHLIKTFENLYPFMDYGGFSYIFLTNNLQDIPDAVKTRCSIIVYDDYTESEIAEVFKLYFPEVSQNLLESLAVKALLNPRISHNLAKRLKIIMGELDNIRDSDIIKALPALGIKEFEPLTQKYIDFLRGKGHASLRSICSATGLSEDIVLNDIEPFLTKRGIIDITSKGRVIVKYSIDSKMKM